MKALTLLNSVLIVITCSVFMQLTGCDRTSGSHNDQSQSTTSRVDGEDGQNQLTTVEFNVTGMTCEHCVDSITEQVSKLDAVASIDVSLEEEKAIVELRDPSQVGDVADSIRSLGFTVTDISNDDDAI